MQVDLGAMNLLRDARLEFLDPEEAQLLISSRKESLKIGPSARLLPSAVAP